MIVIVALGPFEVLIRTEHRLVGSVNLSTDAA